jgi:DNA replication licensing factor MCM3
MKTVHYCTEEQSHTEQSYHDQTSIIGFPTGSAYPTKDAAGHILSTEYGLSHYIDHQTLSLHEMPERTPAGLLPSAVDVVLDDDLVDKCKPGMLTK